ncbi:putative beta-glucosidase [Rosa chinensis]|uniref:Putative beta-glucosidase n=2 Tax=Rosa chinensis TaxID=74649 RepID=A0A2P6R2L3_ROSCH|nr:putative beta-glucosidase [Rosa chinensis]
MPLLVWERVNSGLPNSSFHVCHFPHKLKKLPSLIFLSLAVLGFPTHHFMPLSLTSHYGGQRGIALFIAFQVIIGCLSESESEINRGSFPKGFVFGTASSAFQYEGAVKEDGRGPSVWDIFSHTFGKITDFSNADVAVDQYHLYDGDVQLMKDMGMDAYRFSISWSRIFPNGTGQINQAGVDHYNKLINSLLAKGIEPYVTLYHWDLPQALEDRYIGWLDAQIIKDFAVYAETCFQKFGDRVKHWITFNEPHTFAVQGYDVGLQAPGRCSILLHLFCRAGNSATEPYIVAHNVILSHATVADIYRKKYKSKQKGSIGASFDVIWYRSATNSTADIEATQRAQDFQLGWFLDPFMFGNYPFSMRSRVGSRLPKFSKSESTLIKGSLDFVGINHYTTFYASNDSIVRLLNDSLSDSGAITLPFKDGKPIGDKANSIWLYIVPEGMRSLMNYIKQKYGNPPVMITENGMDDPNSPFISLKDALKDKKRINYHRDYLSNLLASIKEDGCNVNGYFAWSLLDNWEWAAGYTSRFGLYFIDYKDKLKRYPKDSVQWFKNFLTST